MVRGRVQINGVQAPITGHGIMVAFARSITRNNIHRLFRLRVSTRLIRAKLYHRDGELPIQVIVKMRGHRTNKFTHRFVPFNFNFHFIVIMLRYHHVMTPRTFQGQTTRLFSIAARGTIGRTLVVNEPKGNPARVHLVGEHFTIVRVRVNGTR